MDIFSQPKEVRASKSCVKISLLKKLTQKLWQNFQFKKFATKSVAKFSV
jgi:hypothetical protein